MMKVKVTKEFRDKDRFSKIYSVGTLCEFDKERAESLISKGLAEAAEKDNCEPAEAAEKSKRGKKTTE